MTLALILAEDNKIIREALLAAMEELVEIDLLGAAETAADTLSLLADHEHHWQLSVLDLALREGSGLTVLRACKGRRSDQFAVVLSNYATPEIRRHCLELGADAVFDKSTELDSFLTFCKSVDAMSGHPGRAAAEVGATAGTTRRKL